MNNKSAMFLLATVLCRESEGAGGKDSLQKGRGSTLADKLAPRSRNTFRRGLRKLVASICQAQRQIRLFFVFFFLPEEQLDSFGLDLLKSVSFWNKDTIHLSKRASGENEQQMGNGSEYIPAEALRDFFFFSGGWESFFLSTLLARLAPANK